MQGHTAYSPIPTEPRRQPPGRQATSHSHPILIFTRRPRAESGPPRLPKPTFLPSLRVLWNTRESIFLSRNSPKIPTLFLFISLPKSLFTDRLRPAAPSPSDIGQRRWIYVPYDRCTDRTGPIAEQPARETDSSSSNPARRPPALLPKPPL